MKNDNSLIKIYLTFEFKIKNNNDSGDISLYLHPPNNFSML